jgi:hypothetical protein
MLFHAAKDILLLFSIGRMSVSLSGDVERVFQSGDRLLQLALLDLQTRIDDFEGMNQALKLFKRQHTRIKSVFAVDK